ncbi:hypothetical protein [Streptomyces sp. B6B3]|uniref:hypothetical protein n=1 Tax=Streptomyces sp. B6B3 TaxID=3153570 RepID=UPI00325C65AA
MDDQAHATPVPLQFLTSQAEGLCDPATGVCAVPGAPTPGTSPTESAGAAAHPDGATAGLPTDG